MSVITGYTTATHGTPAITPSSGTILAAYPARRYALFVNLGTVTAFLSLGTAAALANSGIPLNPLGTAGDRYEMSRGAANVFTGVVMGIVAAGTFHIATTQG